MSEAITRGDFVDSYGAEPNIDETSLRQATQAKRKKEKEEKEKKEGEEGIISEGMKAGTGRILKYAWLNLVSSFGLTLIYINAHVFLRQIFPDAFCKLGEEWAPKLAVTGGKDIAESFGSAGKTAGIIEVCSLLFLDLAVILIVFTVLGLIVMIIGFIDAGLKEQILMVWSAIKSLGWDAVQPLIDIFKSSL